MEDESRASHDVASNQDLLQTSSTSSRWFSGPTLSESPILDLLNATDKKERDRLTEKWRDHKLEELNFVGIVAALLTGCLTTGTGSWPNFIPGGEAQPWQVRTCWFVGIIFGLTSILSAADQTIRLHRISAHRNAPRRIRMLIRGDKKKTGGQIVPARPRMFIWQLPVFFLICATVAMMTGIWVLVWIATMETGKFVWKENAKSAVAFTVVTGVTAIIFFWSQKLLHASVHEQDDDSEF
ncbi:hypothetical protein E2P81_ATG06632 [Venturia nashicola]|uniref:Uncharacterized protein n=1 Tax=Venturia nashicola TaxID=86259 RepID=A0A4Z1P541_9PEZI|nr:hypothetical protein E6O75_ATG06801 [Venturia nashicola]TLD29979.1 hypothetical protein E2P81_ATG06632 [Venturia nashicola]